MLIVKLFADHPSYVICGDFNLYRFKFNGVIINNSAYSFSFRYYLFYEVIASDESIHSNFRGE